MKVILIHDYGSMDSKGFEVGMVYLMPLEQNEIYDLDTVIFGIKYVPWNYELSEKARDRVKIFAMNNNMEISKETRIDRYSREVEKEVTL